MYSIILATMLTTGAAEPVNFGCHGCHGCCGGCWGCCGGCWGCYGCCGGCYGCCGGCYGCWGASCYGCHGCCGGYYGCWGASCYGCYGSCYGCHGCCGGVVVVPAATIVPAPPAQKVLPTPPKKADLGNAAAVVLKAPVDARLTVEGQTIQRTSAQETFLTPELEQGSSYTYTFKAEIVRDGKPVSFTKQIQVRAGQTSEADFTKLTTEGKDTARVTVKLPADARLYVDDVLCPLTSATRSFNTPELPAGKSYFYNLKSEVVRDGAKRITTKRVVVEAGKQVTVDFKDVPVQAASR